MKMNNRTDSEKLGHRKMMKNKKEKKKFIFVFYLW